MKRISAFLIIIEMISFIFVFTGCWNYREVDKLAIVTGLAIDKDGDNRYLVTGEVVNLKSEGKNVSTTSKRIQTQGETMFDALRSMIKISGKRLYFSHVKVVIIGETVAREGIVEIIDFFIRDAESRLTLHVLISKEKKAAELLSQQSITSEIRSFEIESMLDAQNSVSKAPKVNANELINNLSGKGIAATLPTIGVTTNEGLKTSELSGTAVLKKNKLVGFLDEEDTKYFLIVINKFKGGVIADKKPPGAKEANVTFEVFNSKTKVKPEYSDGKLTMNISVESDVSIGESGTTKNYIDEDGREKLREDAENKIEDEIKKLVEKVQSQYDADIFGFGLKVKQNMPGLWKKVEKDWEEEFQKVNVNVNVKLNIRNSGLLNKPIKVGD